MHVTWSSPSPRLQPHASQAGVSKAVLRRGLTSPSTQLRWLCLAASWGELEEVGALLRSGAPAGGAVARDGSGGGGGGGGNGLSARSGGP